MPRLCTSNLTGVAPAHYRSNSTPFRFPSLLFPYPRQALIKPQYVDNISKAVKGNVELILKGKSQRNNLDAMVDALGTCSPLHSTAACPRPFSPSSPRLASLPSRLCADLRDVLGRDVGDLSGGELQRFAIAMSCIQKADMYVDRVSARQCGCALQPAHGRLTWMGDCVWSIGRQLHVRRAVVVPGREAAPQRGKDDPRPAQPGRVRPPSFALAPTAAERESVDPSQTPLNAHSYVIAVEHDLSVLDYLSDFICVLYGVPGAYGVVSLPFSVREGPLPYRQKATCGPPLPVSLGANCVPAFACVTP